MKKYISLIMAISLVLALCASLCGCGQSSITSRLVNDGNGEVVTNEDGLEAVQWVDTTGKETITFFNDGTALTRYSTYGEDKTLEWSIDDELKLTLDRGNGKINEYTWIDGDIMEQDHSTYASYTTWSLSENFLYIGKIIFPRGN